MRHSPTKSYCGGIGVSAGILTYTAFAAPQILAMYTAPMLAVSASLLYGLYNDEAAVLGSMSASYAAFLMAL